METAGIAFDTLNIYVYIIGIDNCTRVTDVCAICIN